VVSFLKLETLVITLGLIVAALVGIAIGILASKSPYIIAILDDQGHRAFGVPNEKARDVVLHILAKNGFRKWKSFSAGPTHQTVMMDGRTVINMVKKEFLGESSSTGRKATALSR